ncbi:MAG TPA: hypothetical protein VG370_19180 [Chloroflexota bacterium]|jgi:predicted nucleic acid-binding protein|nr:hypothetical protein [Chloroflexota bacterium]
MGYLRIATHPRVFARPLSPDEAIANVAALLRLPRVRVLTVDSDFRKFGFLDVRDPLVET